MGLGIWSMHFIGMLALRMPIAMAYDIPTTLLSLLIAVVVSWFALLVVDSATLTRARLLGAGVLMGGGIASMHYVGMGAMLLAPPIRYDPLLFSASIAIAVAASIAALWIAIKKRTEIIISAFWKKAGSALVMGAAIAGMHFTGIAAAEFAPNTVCSVNGWTVSDNWLAGTIGGFSFMFLAATLLISVFDAHLANRAARYAQRLRTMNANLEQHAADLVITNLQLQGEVQERKRSEARIQYLAHHDSLTDLPNRAKFSKVLNHAISLAKRNDSELAVLFIDLDRFKNINDTFGHDAGDLLLREVAARLCACQRASDTVARLGGDEYVVLLEQLDDPKYAAAVAQKVLTAIAQPFVIVGPGISRHREHRYQHLSE